MKNPISDWHMEERWTCKTCTRGNRGPAPGKCPFCDSERDANHGPHSTVNPDVAVAYDAFESGDPRAMSLLWNLPATVSIGSDRYATFVIKTTPKTITVDRFGTFRFTKRGWTNGSYRLGVGHAEDYRDPSF